MDDRILNEGLVDDFMRKLVGLFASGKSMKDASPALARLAKKDPKLGAALADLDDSIRGMRKFLVTYRKNNPELADLADQLPRV